MKQAALLVLLLFAVILLGRIFVLEQKPVEAGQQLGRMERYEVTWMKWSSIN